MNIGIDLDGVVANSNIELEFRLSKLDIKTDHKKWEAFEFLHNFPDITEEWLHEQFNDPTFWLNAMCYEDAWYVLNRWFSMGHNVYIITSRFTDETIEATLQWLDEWSIPYNELIHSQPKLEKHNKVTEMECAIMVEDNPYAAKLLAEKVPTYLRSHSYNNNYNVGKAVRVENLFSVDSILKGAKL